MAKYEEANPPEDSPAPIEEFQYTTPSLEEHDALAARMETIEAKTDALASLSRSQDQEALDKAQNILKEILASRDVLLEAGKVWTLTSIVDRIAFTLAGELFQNSIHDNRAAKELAHDILVSLSGKYHGEITQGNMEGARQLSLLAKIGSQYPDNVTFAETGKEVQKALRSYLPLFERNLEEGLTNGDRSFVPALQALFAIVQGGASEADRAAAAIAKAFDSPWSRKDEDYARDIDNEVRSMLEGSMDFSVIREGHRESMNIKGPVRKVLEAILKKYDLESDRYILPWANAAFSADFSPDKPLFAMRTGFLLKNMTTIRSLEAKHPGIVSSLRKDFNLACLGRYDEKGLERQYEERDVPGEYFPAFFSNVDHNGALETTRVFENIRKTIGEKEKVLPMRFLEFNDIEEGRALAQAMKEKYGSASCGIVQVHGSEQNILTTGLGLNNERGSQFGTGDVKKGDLGMFGVFAHGARIVLISCSTGVRGGFAQELSRVGSFTVKAPEKEASCDAINIAVSSEGAIDIMPEFSDKFSPVVRNTYKNGVLVESSMPE